MAAWPDPGFGLYVHWPFCQSKCPYCDFNSHVSDRVDASAWKSAYLQELAHFAAMAPDRVLTSIFFGGGTPSLMPPGLVAAIVDAALGHWRTVNDVEVTLEANPTSVEADKFWAFRGAGVNRVSVGVQALDDGDLRALGRLHSVDEALRAVDLAQSTFARSSFDLIYARQNQSLIQWESELARALSLGSDHLSLYQLTVEPGTPFHDRRQRGGLRGLPDDDLQADLFDLTQKMCESAGLPGYEISNHARPGSESRHNLIYWRSGEWVGIGPGAHGRLGAGSGRRSTECLRSPSEWLSAVERAGHGLVASDSLSAFDQDVEFLLMGLRLTEGVDLRRLQVVDVSSATQDLIESGHLKRDGDRLCTTPAGRPLLNMLLRELIPDRP